jgi:hypothetical protein
LLASIVNSQFVSNCIRPGVLLQNSFEQLCINLANEALQQHFNVNIFQHEMEIYESEGIIIPDLSYNDNQDVLDLIIKRPKGLIPMLDEEGQVPRGSVEGFLSKFTKQHAASVRLKYRAGGKDFVVVHYAGEVRYDPSLFMIKNKDTLSQDLVDLMGMSAVPLFAELFREAAAGSDPPAPPMGSPSPLPSSKKMSSAVGVSSPVQSSSGSNKQTVGTRFRIQLDSLIANLNSTEPRYIRCIKPNQVKKPDIFEPALTNEQLTYSGVFEAVVIMQNGYPFRMSHIDFVSRYHMLAIPSKAWNQIFDSNASQDNPSKAISHSLVEVMSRNISEVLKHCHVGKTMVFYRSEQHRLLEKERKALWDRNLALLQRWVRGAMARHLVRLIRSAAASCSKFIDDREVDLLKDAKDALLFNCNKLHSITRVVLFDALQSLSRRYYDVAALQRTAIDSITALMERKGQHKDGLLPLFDELEHLVNQSKKIDFHESFHGREITIHWSATPVLVEANSEVESLRIIKSIKSNLETGVMKMDEVLLKEWIEKLNSYRSLGLVPGNFCREEEAKALIAIEVAQKQFQDFIGSAYSAICEGQFKYTLEQPAAAENLAKIVVSVDARPLLSYVDKNRKMLLSKNSVQVRQTLIVCEKLCELRDLASRQPVEWNSIWNVLQKWRRYFSSSSAIETYSEASKAATLARSGSIARSSIVLAPGAAGLRGRSSILGGYLDKGRAGEDASAAPSGAADDYLVPWVSDIATQVTVEVQGMVACCLEAVLFQQLKKEVDQNRIPTRVIYGSVLLHLDSMNHCLTHLSAHTKSFTSTQLTRYNDAKERWSLRRGICSRNADLLLSALSRTGDSYRLPDDDPEYIAAKGFCDLFICERDLRNSLKDDGLIGVPGLFNLGEIRVQRICDALLKAKSLSVHEPSSQGGDGKPSEWKLLLDSSERVAEVRRFVVEKQYSSALAAVDKALQASPWSDLARRIAQGSNGDRLAAQELLLGVQSAAAVSAATLFRPPPLSSIPEYFSCAAVQVEAADGPVGTESEGQTPAMTSTIELIRLKDEMLHLQAMEDIRLNVVSGALDGDVGELDVGKVLVEPLQASLRRAVTCVIPSAETIAIITCASGISVLRSWAKALKWDAILSYLRPIFAAGEVGSREAVDVTLKKLPELFRNEYSVFYAEAMDLQIRDRLLEACESGNITIDAVTGALNIAFVTVDKLKDALKFAEERPEKSIECAYLCNSVKLLYAMRVQVLANNWDNAHSKYDFPQSLVLNSPIETACADLIQRLSALKASLQSERYSEVVKAKSKYILDLNQCYSIDEDAVVDVSSVASYLESSRVELDRCLTSNAVTHSPSGERIETTVLPLSDIFVYAVNCGYHEAASDEIDCVLAAFRERCCKLLLVLAASVGCVDGTIDTLNSSGIEIDQLSAALEFARLFLSSPSSSEQIKLYYDTAMDLMNVRLAVAGSIECVDLLTYFGSNKLKDMRRRLDELQFPYEEIRLVINHISDSVSIAELVDAIHLGRKFYLLCVLHMYSNSSVLGPQFYMGKFDTRNVAYEHIISNVEAAKKLSKRSDRLDRLMFYSELCVMLRKAVVNHQWDLSEQGERSSEPKARGISVRQCLDDYMQSEKFFLRKMSGIPPRTLVDEFGLAKQEWERRIILQGFPMALQSGQMGGAPGAVELREVKYARLQQQIEKAVQWSLDTGVKDPELEMLKQAANEIVDSRKALILVHSKYLDMNPITTETPPSSKAKGLEGLIKSLPFINEAMQAACGKVAALLQPPYVMLTEWDPVQAAVVKMEVSGRLRSTRLQVETLAAETFERSFSAGIISVLHSLSLTVSGKTAAARELLGLCRSHHVRWLEMKKHLSLRFSEKLETLYASAMFIIHLFVAENSLRYDEFKRDWLSAEHLTQIGTSVTPALLQLEQILFVGGNSDYSVQAIIRATMCMKHELHPVAMRQLARARRHVDDEITIQELTRALRSGTASGRVGSMSFESISNEELVDALHRAYDTARADQTLPSLFIQCLSIPVDPNVSWRAPCRLKYSPQFTAAEVSIIDLTIGWGSGLSSQLFSEKWGNRMKVIVEEESNAVAAQKEGKKASKWGVLRAHLKAGNIVSEFKYLDEVSIKQALSHSSMATLATLCHRPDVIQMRNSCELICELRRCMKSRDYAGAFEILTENMGRPGYSFSDMFKIIYNAQFSIHPLAMEEFSLISLEVCESYWRLLALKALSAGVASGSRSRVNVCDISWTELDDVLCALDGLLEISRESIILRELCYMVKCMRQLAVAGGRSGLRSRCADGPIAGKEGVADITRENMHLWSFLDESIQNAVNVLSVVSDAVAIPNSSAVSEAYSALAAADRVYECLEVLDPNNISPDLRQKLLRECELLRDHNKFVLAGAALEEAFRLEALWFSYSASSIEFSGQACAVLQSAAEGMRVLQPRVNVFSEARWAHMLAAITDLVAIMGLDGLHDVDAQAESSLSKASALQSSLGLLDAAANKRSAALQRSLVSLRALSNYISTQRSRDIGLIENYERALVDSLNEHINIASLLAVVSGARAPSESDGFDQMEIGAVLNHDVSVSAVVTSPLPMKLASFRGAVIWKIACLHVHLRSAIGGHEWSTVEAIADAIIAADLFDVRSSDVADAKLCCNFLKIKRCLEQGISACILPPFPGWSSFSSFPSIVRNVSDYYLRDAVAEHEEFIRESAKNGSGKVFDDFHLVVELLDVAIVMIDLVSALRGARWTRDSVVVAKQAAERKERRASFSKETVQKQTKLGAIGATYLSSSEVVVEGPSSAGSAETVTLEEVTQELDLAYDVELKTVRVHHSVEAACADIQDRLDSGKLTAENDVVGAFLSYTISNLTSEIQFINLDDRVKLAIDECSLTGRPGKLFVPTQPYSLLKSCVDGLDKNGIYSGGLMGNCIALLRAFQSAKLLLSALKAVSTNASWTDLRAILSLYSYMDSLNWTDPEEETTSLMIPITFGVHEILDVTESDFYGSLNGKIGELTRVVSSVSGRLAGSSASAAIAAAADSPEAEPMRSKCRELLGCDLEQLLKAHTGIMPFMHLLDKHCAFLLAVDMFSAELRGKGATGTAGNLIVNSIDVANLEVIVQIIRSADVVEEGYPSYYLLNAAAALLELRIAQKQAPEVFDVGIARISYSGGPSVVFSDLEKAVLKAELCIKLENEHNAGIADVGDAVIFITGATEEIELARADFNEKCLILMLLVAITSDRVHIEGCEDELVHAFVVTQQVMSRVSVDKLGAALGRYASLAGSVRCEAAQRLRNAADKLQEIRILALSSSWNDVIELLDQEKIFSSDVDPSTSSEEFSGCDDFIWYKSYKHELLLYRRLAAVSIAVETSNYALTVGSIPSSPLGSINPKRLNVLVVTRALDELGKIPVEWRSPSIKSFIFTLDAIQSVRQYAASSEWNTLRDVCLMILSPERRLVKPILEAGLAELDAALEQASYYLSEFHLTAALSSTWSMKGAVGSVDCTCVSALVLKEAVSRADELGCTDVDYISLLQSSARIIYDLRRAQLHGLWMSSDKASGEMQQQLRLEDSLIATCLPMSAPPEGGGEGSGSAPSPAGISSGFLSLNTLFTSDHNSLNDEVPDIPAFVKWLMKNSTIDEEIIERPEASETIDEVLCVEEVLEGADYVRDLVGLAEIVQDEIEFARREWTYRRCVAALLGALSEPGCRGSPGDMEIDSPDVSPEEGKPSLTSVIEEAERHADISSRGCCRWLLRDAKLISRLRKARRARDWVQVREVLLEAFDQNDSEAMNEQNNPRISLTRSYSQIMKLESSDYQPIIAPVWTEILFVRADFNFYACLADFAQEISNGTRRDSDADPKDRRSLSQILLILLRTKAAALLWPCDEFDRLIEAQEAALELRAQRFFDSGHFPTRSVILRVNEIRERDRFNGVTCYADLLRPEINLLSDMMDVQNLVDTLENALSAGQGYLRCPIGHISRQEMELEQLGSAVKECLLHKLDASGTPEHAKLVRFGNLMYNIRKNAADGNWSRVTNLIDTNMGTLRGRVSTAEEIGRLQIEAQNHQACQVLRLALSTDRFTNVLDLVKRISKQKLTNDPEELTVSQSESSDGTSNRHQSIYYLRRSSRRESFWRASFDEDILRTLTTGSDGFSDVSSSKGGMDKLESAINSAMGVHHKSETTSSLLKAAVLIRSLRAAISAGYWDEVHQIVSEESNYRNTRVPQETLEEIRVAKAALHYRNCMIALSKGLIIGRATGSPGDMNLSSIECISLQSAISQAEVLEISADPGALIMLDIARCVCALRQAIMASRWFTKADTTTTTSELLSEASQLPAAPADIHVPVETPSGTVAASAIDSPVRLSFRQEIEEWSDNDGGDDSPRRAEEGSNGRGSFTSRPESALALRKNVSVEEAIELLKVKLANLPEDWSEDSATDVGPLPSADETLSSENSLDWIALQARAIRSTRNEVDLLDDNMKERRRQEYIVTALENVPAAVQSFRSGASSSATGRAAAGAVPGSSAGGASKQQQQSGASSEADQYLVKPLAAAIEAAKGIPGVVSDDTAKLIRTAELILCFRKAMNDLEIDDFKKLIESARVQSENGLISGHYGVFELSTYRSATMTVNMSKAELIKAMKAGTVKGTISNPLCDQIDVDLLQYWVGAHEEIAKDMTISLKSALIEAQIVLLLRKKCKIRDWLEVRKILDLKKEDIANFVCARDDVEFIDLASRVELNIRSIIDEINLNPFPRTLEEQFAYVTVRMNEMNAASSAATDILVYLEGRGLVSKEEAEGEVATSGTNGNDQEGSHYAELNTVTYEESNVRLAWQCRSIKRLYKLWVSIEGRRWHTEPIAAGMVHAFPRPSDPFLDVFLHQIRQHEVGQRLAGVHNQIHLLKIRADRKVKNIKQSVRASVAFVLRKRVSDVTEESSPPMATSIQDTLKARSELFKSGAVKQASPATISKTSQDARRGSFLAVTSKPPPALRKRGPGALVPVPEAGRPTHAPPLPPRAKRRTSIGAIAQDMSVVRTEEEVMAMTAGAAAAGEDKLASESKSNSILGTVAYILCSENWSLDPDFAREQYNTARNALIDHIIQMRLMWGCTEGCIDESEDGEVISDAVSIDLLKVSLSDVRKVMFYINQNKVSFEFSALTLNMIHCSRGILNCREATIAGKFDELVSELRHLKYVVDKHSVKRMDLPQQCPSSYSEIEFELFQKLACQQYSLSRFIDAIHVVLSAQYINADLFNNPVIAALGEKELNGISPSTKVTPTHALTLLLGLTLKSALCAAHSGNKIRLQHEFEVSTSLLNDEPRPFDDAVCESLNALYKQLFSVVSSNGAINVASSVQLAHHVLPAPTTSDITTSKSEGPGDSSADAELQMALDAINVFESSSEAVQKIFNIILICFRKSRNRSSFVILSDLIDNLKLHARILDSSTADQYVDPWLVLCANIILTCTKPAYLLDVAGRHLHSVPFSVGEFLSDTAANSTQRGKMNASNQAFTFNVALLGSFLRRLVCEAGSVDGSKEAKGVVLQAESGGSSVPFFSIELNGCITKAKEKSERVSPQHALRLFSEESAVMNSPALALRFAKHCDYLINCVSEATEEVTGKYLDSRSVLVRNAISKRRKQLKN